MYGKFVLKSNGSTVATVEPFDLCACTEPFSPEDFRIEGLVEVCRRMESPAALAVFRLLGLGTVSHGFLPTAETRMLRRSPPLRKQINLLARQPKIYTFVPANGVEPLSKAYESFVLTVELRRRRYLRRLDQSKLYYVLRLFSRLILRVAVTCSQQNCAKDYNKDKELNEFNMLESH